MKHRYRYDLPVKLIVINLHFSRSTSNMNSKHLATGLSSALMACTGGAILTIHSANHLGMNERELLSWLFISYAVAGLFNLILALRYKLPIAGAHSITAMAFLSTASISLTLPQLTASFLIAGLLIAILGFTGIFNTLLKHIPREIIDAMLAGIIMQYVLLIVPSFQASPIVGALAVIGYLVMPKLSKAIPPIVGVIVFGFVGLLCTYQFPATVPMHFELPVWITPQFTWQGVVSVAIPIAVLTLSNDLAVSIAALTKQGYHPPVNKMITYSGVTTALSSFFISHSVNTGGMMTTLCSSEDSGEKSKRYLSGVVSSVICMMFGIFAWKLVPYITVLPQFFIAIIIGFSLLGVFTNSLTSAFTYHSERYSVVFAFIISAANVSFLGISSALWSLIVGSLLAAFLRKEKTVN